MENKLIFDQSDAKSFAIGSEHGVSAILVDSSDHEAVHIAAQTFAEDVERVIGKKPVVYFDQVPKDIHSVIIACTAESSLSAGSLAQALKGQWESFDIRVGDTTAAKDTCLLVTGSDKVRAEECCMYHPC